MQDKIIIQVKLIKNKICEKLNSKNLIELFVIKVIKIIKSIFYVSIAYGLFAFFWFYFEKLYSPIADFYIFYILFVFLPAAIILSFVILLFILFVFLPEFLIIKLKNLLGNKVRKFPYVLLKFPYVVLTSILSFILIIIILFNLINIPFVIRFYTVISIIVIKVVFIVQYLRNKLSEKDFIEILTCTLKLIIIFTILIFPLFSNPLFKIFKLADVPVEIQLKNEFAINNQTIIEGCLISRFGDEIALIPYDNFTNKHSTKNHNRPLLVIPKAHILNLKFANNETMCNELKDKKQ